MVSVFVLTAWEFQVYDRKPFLSPTDYGIKKSKEIAKQLGRF